MSRSIDRSSDRTLPLLSFAARAAGARGGASPPDGRSDHGKPEPPPGRRQTRGDPPGTHVDWGGCALHPYGHSSGSITRPDSYSREDPPPFGAATGPPGRKTAHSVNHWPPPGHHAKGGSPPGRRQARGDPPGSAGLAWGSDPPRSRAGPSPPGSFSSNRRGPPGSTATHSSLSAGRRRGPLLVTRLETARQDAARKPKPKSRKITPWLLQ